MKPSRELVLRDEGLENRLSEVGVCASPSLIWTIEVSTGIEMLSRQPSKIICIDNEKVYRRSDNVHIFEYTR